MRKILTFLFCLLFLCMPLTGCSTTPSAKEKAASGETVELTIGLCDLNGSWEDDATAQYVKAVQEKFGVTLVPYDMSLLNANPANALAAPLPDLMSFPVEDYPFIYSSLIETGRIREIPQETAADFPIIADLIDGISAQTSVKGQQYFLPRLCYAQDNSQSSSVVIYYRRDWAKNANIGPFDTEAPQWSQFFELMRAYTYDDPNANNSADTWGLTTYGEGFGGLYEAFFMPYGVRDWVYEDGKWIPGLLSERAREAMKWLNYAYRDGYIDTNYAQYSLKEAIDRFCVGKAGMLILPATREAVNMLETRWNELQPENYIGLSVSVLPQPITSTGITYNETHAFQGGILFSSELKGEKMNKALEVLEWMYSQDGIMTATYGIVGEDYTTVDGKPLSTHLQYGDPVLLKDCSENMNALSLFANRCEDGVKLEYLSDYQQYTLSMAKTFYWPNTWGRLMFTDYALVPSLLAYHPEGQIETLAAEFCLHGTGIDEGWDEYVQNVIDKLGLEEIIEEVNAYAQEKGITSEE